MTQNFDLFGDPIPENWGMRGRPQHVVTEESAFKVKLLVAGGRTQKFISDVLGISVPTFKEYYFSIWQDRKLQRDRLKAALQASVFKAALEGSVPAQKLAYQILKDEEAVDAQAQIAARQERAREKAKQQPKGKKEQRQDAANSVGGLYATPPAPGQVN